MKGYLKVSERYDNACTTGCHYLQTPLLQLRAVRHFYFHFQGRGPLTRAQKSPLKVCKISPANSSGKKTSESITTDQISNCCSRQLCSTLYRSPSLFLVHKHYNHEWDTTVAVASTSSVSVQSSTKQESILMVQSKKLHRRNMKI